MNFLSAVFFIVLTTTMSCNESPLSFSNSTDSLNYSTLIGLMIYVSPGSFQRDGNPNNISQISPFRISQTEITQTQFTTVTGLQDPNTLTSTNGPVNSVNFYHTLVFCNTLSQMENLRPVYSINGSTDPTVWLLGGGGVPISSHADWNNVAADWNANGYRLPTRMEWMWAAMGATSGFGYFGNVYTAGYNKEFAGSDKSNSIDAYAWHSGNSGSQIHPVGSRKANELGLYDMSGNTKEWCWDWVDSIPEGILIDYKGPTPNPITSSSQRIISGGDVNDPPSFMILNAFAAGSPAAITADITGFRVVRP